MATIFVLTSINLLTVKAFGELEFWLAIVKVIAIVGLIVVGLWLSVTGFVSPDGTKASVANLWTHNGFFRMVLRV